MENYTKYRLKSTEELAPLLAGRDNLFVIACNKCFKEFETVDEPDCDEFLKFAAEQGKTVTGSVKIDFLCNKTQTIRKLKDAIPQGTEAIFVISCGLGIQTIADLEQIPVFAASNSLNYTGHHGMALTKKACDACAQCYLNITGGICPIVDCSKSLVNGQCGGAKNGKCEVSPDKDCAWEKINARLTAQGRLEEFKFIIIVLISFSSILEPVEYLYQPYSSSFQSSLGIVLILSNDSSEISQISYPKLSFLYVLFAVRFNSFTAFSNLVPVKISIIYLISLKYL